jgi:DNA-directed RNA polymerase specialized sigma24 family protein
LAITKLRPDGNPKAWLNQVVDNLCANHQRKEGRRAHLTAKWSLEQRPPNDGDREGENESE